MKDKKELKKSSYVAYDDIVEFPQPVAFTIKGLKIKLFEYWGRDKLRRLLR